MNIRANGIKQSFRKMFLRVVASVIVAFPLAALAAPAVLYTDIDSGPNTGGENNNGAYLSIFGKGFGTNLSQVKVYVGNGEVARYMYLGTSLGRPDVQELSVQLGPNTSTGAIKVTVNGVASNTDHSFTVRSGNFYFISPNGNNGSGVKNDITHPYASANYVVNLSSFQAGDFIIALPGTYTLSQTDASNNSDSWLRATASGTTSAPVAFLGYPGHQTLVRHSQGIRIISNYVSIANWVVGNFAITLTDCSGNHAGEIVDIGPTASPSVCSDTAGTMSGTATNIKLVNMEANGNNTGGLCSGGDGLIEIQHSKNVKIIGVSLHNTSPAQGDSESAHPIYLSASQTGTEIGWNAVYNIPATRGVIQVHQDSFGGACWGSKQLTNIKIHDNVEHDLAGQAILLDGGTGDIQLYNNIIYNHKDHRYSDVISLRGDGGQLNASLYNNTIYANADVSGTGFLIGIGGDTGGMPKHVTLYNNIFYLTDPQDAWYGGDWTNPQSWINAGNLTSANNLWYGSNNGKPSFAGSSELNVDPLFVDASVGNLRLTSPTSPAIDSGTSLTNTVVTLDLDGNARPQGSAPDIGAYEATGATLPAPQNVVLRLK